MINKRCEDKKKKKIFYGFYILAPAAPDLKHTGEKIKVNHLFSLNLTRLEVKSIILL